MARDIFVIVFALGLGCIVGGIKLNLWRGDAGADSIYSFGPALWKIGVGIALVGGLAWLLEVLAGLWF
jgi:hypothetical protein